MVFHRGFWIFRVTVFHRSDRRFVSDETESFGFDFVLRPS